MVLLSRWYGAYSAKMAIFVLKTTANREDQVIDFVASNAQKKGFDVYALVRLHNMRGYILVEAAAREEVELASRGVPYARGILKHELDFKEIEPTLEQVKAPINIQKDDIIELVSGPFKHEKARVTRVDQQKEEATVELLEAAVPIPVTVKLDSVRVIRREEKKEEDKSIEN